MIGPMTGMMVAEVALVWWALPSHSLAGMAAVMALCIFLWAWPALQPGNTRQMLGLTVLGGGAVAIHLAASWSHAVWADAGLVAGFAVLGLLALVTPSEKAESLVQFRQARGRKPAASAPHRATGAGLRHVESGSDCIFLPAPPGDRRCKPVPLHRVFAQARGRCASGVRLRHAPHR